MPELTIDWISLTYPDSVPMELTEELFQGSWTPRKQGGHGYRQAVQNGYLVLLYDGNPGMGHHLRLSSHALRQIEGQTDFPGWSQWLQSQLMRGAKPTRIDLALDDHEGLLDLKVIRRHLDNGDVTTRFRSYTHKQDFQMDSPASAGEIITLGSRTSNAYIRIYDRAARLQRPEHWIRLELECKDTAAITLADAIALAADDSALGALAVGVITQLIQFRKPHTNLKNKTRRPLADWWRRFCEAADPVSLSLGQPPRTIDKAKDWIYNQAAPTIAAIIIALEETGESPEDWLAHVIASGQSRLSPVHEQMIQQAICNLRPRNTVRGRTEAEGGDQRDDD